MKKKKVLHTSKEIRKAKKNPMKYAGNPKEEFIFRGLPPLTTIKKRYASVEIESESDGGD